ncbi:nuclear pore complex assembly-domain-containing protein [Sphaerosporella brunnea]|uniref:Nuclear pore complex assembly-domain-containing protein n=1 Tax=Sphaerosporella brunnea TaxID=1250544 RepID=A0A5J5F013_9PEZI|nr:nuclear pore complex assembly-domain-containing protein [Sphaerosporella brunnea]
MDIPEDPALEFRAVFGAETKNPYPKSRVEEIQQHRQLLDGELFFDNLLISFAKIKDVPTHYPPHSLSSLKSLHNLIVTSPHLDSLKKHALLYYLLLDLPTQQQATAFAQRVLLPQNFMDLITALHLLDTLSLEDSIRFLTLPAVTPPLPEKILHLLYKHGNPSLAVTFISAVQPVLESPEAMETYFQAQLRLSPEAAFLYSRQAPGYLQAKFLRMLVDYCINTNPAVNALRLVNLPFTEEEKKVFEEGLKSMGGEVARDTLVVWQMHQGRVDEALKGTKAAAAKGDAGVSGVDWDALGRGLEKGLGSRLEV